MTAEACREWRGALGAAAIDRIDGDDAVALQAHLDGCAACREELRDLRSVVDAMASADVDRLRERPEPPGDLGERVLGRVLRARSETRARQWAHRGAIAAALVLVVLVAAALVVFVGGDDDDRAVVAFTVAPSGVDAEVALATSASGTEVELRAHGLDPGAWYWLWLTGDDERRVAAGTFRGEPAGQRVVMTAAIALDDTRRIWVTDGADAIVLDVELD